MATKCLSSYDTNCGCPQNEGICRQNPPSPPDGNPCVGLAFGSCSTQAPCNDGSISICIGPGNTCSGPQSDRCSGPFRPSLCQCDITDYSRTKDSSSYQQCCLGTLTGNCNCAPGWCPNTKTADCDKQMLNFYKTCGVDKNAGSPCSLINNFQNYCKIIPNGSNSARRDTQGHFCQDYTVKYCSEPSNIMSPYCQDSINPIRQGAYNKGLPPSWADIIVTKFCYDNVKSQDPDIINFCSCINSNVINQWGFGSAACLDPKCINGSAYHTSNQLPPALNCPNICATIINANTSGGNIDIDNNTFIQQCGVSLNKYYDIDSTGKCVESNYGCYSDSSCKNKFDKCPTKPTNNFLIILIIIIVVVVVLLLISSIAFVAIKK